MTPETADRVYGIDFSGASAAGEGIWIATVRIDDGVVERCDRVDRILADRYPGPAVVDRAPTLRALRRFLRSLDGTAVVGIDSPFGLPASVASGAFGASTWNEQLRVITAVDGPEVLSRRCRVWAETHTDSTFIKRETDAETGAFSPYHWFVRYQTYHGIAGLLAPLVAVDAVTVLPMHATDPIDTAPTLLETYPAATFDRLGRSREGYKDADATARERRAANLDGLLDAGGLRLGRDVDRGCVIEDDDGDALDSLAAACAAARFVREPVVPGGIRRVEGHIYT